MERPIINYKFFCTVFHVHIQCTNVMHVIFLSVSCTVFSMQCFCMFFQAQNIQKCASIEYILLYDCYVCAWKAQWSKVERAKETEKTVVDTSQHNLEIL
jgi:hypothetical protein